MPRITRILLIPAEWLGLVTGTVFLSLGNSEDLNSSIRIMCGLLGFLAYIGVYAARTKYRNLVLEEAYEEIISQAQEQSAMEQ